MEPKELTKILLIPGILFLGIKCTPLIDISWWLGLIISLLLTFFLFPFSENKNIVEMTKNIFIKLNVIFWPFILSMYTLERMNGIEMYPSNLADYNLVTFYVFFFIYIAIIQLMCIPERDTRKYYLNQEMSEKEIYFRMNFIVLPFYLFWVVFFVLQTKMSSFGKRKVSI